MTWADVKGKLSDVLKTFVEAIDTKLVTHFDESVIDKGIAFTTTAAEHKRTVNVTALATISLGDAATMAVGYIVTVKNSHTAPITVDLATGADTLDGTVGGSMSLEENEARTFITTTGADGYLKTSMDFGDSIIATDATVTVITGQTELSSGLAGTDELLVNDGGAIKRMDTDVLAEYLSGYLTDIQSVGAASGVDIEFTGLPAGLDRFEILINGLSTNGSSDPTIQLGDAGGYEATGYTGSVHRFASSTVVSTSFSTGFAFAGAWNSSNVVGSGRFVFIRFNGNIWILDGSASYSSSLNALKLDGVKTLTGEITSVRIRPINGTDNWDAGDARIIYHN